MAFQGVRNPPPPTPQIREVHLLFRIFRGFFTNLFSTNSKNRSGGISNESNTSREVVEVAAAATVVVVVVVVVVVIVVYYY